MTTPCGSLIYLSYGAGPHEKEIAFSVMSACRWSGPDQSYRVTVYTDRPESYKDLPVTIQYVPPDQWTEWAGPNRFAHRCKVLALQHAAQRCDGAVAILDGDTWFRAPVQRLFERVRPGMSVMHIREGLISTVDTEVFRRTARVLAIARRRDVVAAPGYPTAETVMWNAGVVGIDRANVELLDEVLRLTDQLTEVSDLHVLEQLAFSHTLGLNTRLRESHDLVFHYWPPYLRAPFRARLDTLYATAGGMGWPDRAEFLFSNRPRPTWRRRCKVVAKRVLQTAGLVDEGCRTNEW